MGYAHEFSYRDCPWCQTKNIAFVKAGNTIVVNDSKHNSHEWRWLYCPRCGGVISIETRANTSPNTLLRVVPDRREDLDVEHLPNDSVLSHVRKIGNQGAHATDEQLTEQEVRYALNFTTQILRNLFEVPETLRLLSAPDEQSENIEA